MNDSAPLKIKGRIKREELKSGEIYVFDNAYINKIGNPKDNKLIIGWIDIAGKTYYNQPTSNSSHNIRIATEEEKHHLNECIRLNYFVTREEAMKTFKKESPKSQITKTKSKVAIEATDSEGSIFKIGDTVRKPKDKTTLRITGFYENEKNEVIVTTDRFKININSLEHCIVKEIPKFELPEKWCVRNVNTIIADYFNNKIGSISKIYNHTIHFNRFLHSEDNRNNNVLKHQKIQASISYSYIKPNFTEITFEQFKQYVLFGGYKVGDVIEVWGKCTITRLEYIDGCAVAFFRTPQGNTAPNCRILIKNINRKWD